jgi:hypothetical protein
VRGPYDGVLVFAIDKLAASYFQFLSNFEYLLA